MLMMLMMLMLARVGRPCRQKGQLMLAVFARREQAGAYDARAGGARCQNGAAVLFMGKAGAKTCG